MTTGNSWNCLFMVSFVQIAVYNVQYIVHIWSLTPPEGGGGACWTGNNAAEHIQFSVDDNECIGLFLPLCFLCFLKKFLFATKLQYFGKTTALAKTKFADTFAFLFYSFHFIPIHFLNKIISMAVFTHQLTEVGWGDGLLSLEFLFMCCITAR